MIFFLKKKSEKYFLRWTFPEHFQKIESFLFFIEKIKKKTKKNRKIEKSKMFGQKSKNPKNSDLNCWNLYIRVLNLSAGK